MAYLRVLCFKPMQTYYLCVILLGLCGCIIYLVIFTSARIFSPLDPRINGALYAGNLTVPGAGFVMALDYSDQLTGGGMNLFCLQCIAYSIEPQLVVVEPFVVQSTFGASLNLQNPSFETPWKGNAVRMSDVYDISKWLQYSKQECYAPLVSWEALLEAAPRNVVLVQHTWSDYCSLNKLEELYAPFFHLYKFRVVREVCFNFQSSGKLELWRYKQSIYGDLDPLNVTVVYDKWFGVDPNVKKFAVSISDSKCDKANIGPHLFYELHAVPSKKLFDHSALYISRFLSRDTDHMYIAVMLRLEQVLLSAPESASKRDILSKCLESIVKKWEYMKKTTGITQTFLTLDYGKYGSKGFQLHKYLDKQILDEKLESFLKTMGQGNLTLLESRISQVAGTENPGYIASLQKVISSKARCLITAGGGTFNAHAHVMHTRLYGKTCRIIL